MEMALILARAKCHMNLGEACELPASELILWLMGMGNEGWRRAE